MPSMMAGLGTRVLCRFFRPTCVFGRYEERPMSRKNIFTVCVMSPVSPLFVTEELSAIFKEPLCPFCQTTSGRAKS